jgi:hypothetical protein
MTMKKRSAWTREEIEDFRQWHKNLLLERGYPLEIVDELTEARDKWLASIPLK